MIDRKIDPLTRWLKSADSLPWGVHQRRKMYHGHGIKDVTELYERHEVAAFLDSDADLLRQHLGDEKRHLAVVNT